MQERNTLKRVHQETFGKSGCRRIVPGQMVATDPKGRACMIAAVEKQKVRLRPRACAAQICICQCHHWQHPVHTPHRFP